MTASVVAVAGQKGGVGKTTLAVHLAWGLARRGARVLLLDADPQGQAGLHLGLPREAGLSALVLGRADPWAVLRQPASPAAAPASLWVLPSNKETASAQLLFAARGRGLDLVAAALEPYRAHFRYIIVDTAPGLGGLQEGALLAADLVLVATGPDPFGLDGVDRLLETLGGLARRFGRAPRLLGVVLNLYEERSVEGRAVRERLSARFGPALLGPVHRAALFRRAAARGTTVFELDPASRAAREAAALVKFVREASRWKGNLSSSSQLHEPESPGRPGSPEATGSGP